MSVKKNWVVVGKLGIEPDGETVWCDLHKFRMETALDFARELIECAWRKGFARVTCIHGARGVRSSLAASQGGRGAIKWALRGALANGEYMAWAWYRRSRKHDVPVEGSRITIALRPNPSPEPDLAWPELPDLDY